MTLWKPGDPPIGSRQRAFAKLGRLHQAVGRLCPYCERRMLDRGCQARSPSRDHKIPLSRGGLHTRSNIQICCRQCNEEKGSLTHEEFLAVRAGRASRLDIKWNAERAKAAQRDHQRPNP